MPRALLLTQNRGRVRLKFGKLCGIWGRSASCIASAAAVDAGKGREQGEAMCTKTVEKCDFSAIKEAISALTDREKQQLQEQGMRDEGPNPCDPYAEPPLGCTLEKIYSGSGITEAISALTDREMQQLQEQGMRDEGPNRDLRNPLGLHHGEDPFAKQTVTIKKTMEEYLSPGPGISHGERRVRWT